MKIPKMVINNKRYIFDIPFVKDIFFALYFFVTLFQPPFCGIKTRYILIGFNFVLFIIFMFIHGKIKISRELLKIIVSFIPFFLYFALMQYIHMETDSERATIYFSLLKTIINVYLNFIVSIFAIKLMFDTLNVDFSGFVRYISLAVVLQFVCVLASFLNSTIKSYFLRMILLYSEEDTVKHAILAGQKFRCYGYADNLFDSFGYIVSMLICLVLLEGICSKNTKLILLGLFSLIMPVLNARTGVVLSILGILIIFLYYFRVNIKTIIITMIIISISLVLGAFFVQKLPKSNLEWFMRGYNEIIDLFSGNTKSGTFNEIFNKDLVFPSNINQLILGMGAMPESITSYNGIDSGYVQCIWRFGIIGTILLMLAYFNMFRIAYFSTKNKKYKCLIAIIALIFYIYLFKLYSIANCGAVIMIYVIPSIIVEQKFNNKDKNNYERKSISNGCYSYLSKI